MSVSTEARRSPGNRRVRRRMLLGLALALALVGGSPSAAEDGEGGKALLEDAGRDLYMRHCSACHGIDARGDGPAAAALKTSPSDLTTIRRRREGSFPAADLSRIIDGRLAVQAHGTRDMPIWGRRFSEELSDQNLGEEWARGQISVLIDYLRTLQR